ncbi:hypothetical protein FD724_06595 [Nostoc sp. C057]|uniref:hypothetical protein n=1 Tax=Nostoc sp. C057 TaxID=2576903 RepID=UPI0015C3BC04|nr:hypothetical protein [Nostoc sp. C057]QLE47808.1 hypothetical protein FD724_06595 [Nostoc sp. C057]
MIISIPKPQRDEKGKIRGEFYPLQRAELLALRDSELARGPFYVHLCLRFENPWCDRPFSVSVVQFCKRWHIPESNFYRAVGKLQEMEILDWEPREIFFYWKSPTSESQFPVVGDSPSSESQFPVVGDSPSSGSEIPTSESNSPSSGSEIPTSESNSPSSGNLQSSKPLLDKTSGDGYQQTIQTYSDLEKTLSDRGECEKLLDQEEDIKTEHLTSLFSKTKNNAQPTNPHLDNCSAAATSKISPAIKYDAALGIKPPSQSDAHWTLIYDGGNTPWLEAPKGRQLCWNQAFLRWQGERWMQKYSKADIYEAIADFRASLLNNPERIVNRWQEYQDHMTHHAVVAQVRVENGIELTQTETKKLQTHHRGP